ncbi:MAG: OmpA family protein [Geminicoccaceae bacterium]
MTCLNRLAVLLGTVCMVQHSAVEAVAGDAVLMENDASRCEIFRAISPDVPEECRLPSDAGQDLGRTRGIRVHNPDAAAGMVDEAGSRATPVAAEPEAFAIAMQIQFEFDSAQLTHEAKMTLGQVAQVLRDDLMQGKVVLLEGHADAAGPEDYNLDLSTRRAASVHDFLVGDYGVANERLRTTGRGEYEPFDPVDPYAAINRRVEFTNLTD